MRTKLPPANGLLYGFGFANNSTLQRRVCEEDLSDSARWLWHVNGYQPVQLFHAFEDYQADTWTRTRRIVTKVEITQTGGLNVRHVVTNLSGHAAGIYCGFYTQRGNVPERPIGELKNGLAMDRLSSPRFLANDYKLLVHVLAYLLYALTDESIRFCGRIKRNAVLERLAEPYLKRPVGRPPAGGYEDVIELGSYQAGSWRHAQRLILVIVDQPDPKTGQLNLLPRYFFLVTNWTQEQRDGEVVLEHYRQRGTFEDRLGEFTAAIGCRLSSSDFAENEITMLWDYWLSTCRPCCDVSSKTSWAVAGT